MNTAADIAAQSARWLPEHVAGIARQPGAALPVIRADQVVPMLPGHVVWDMWQVMEEDGATVVRDGRSFWFFLTAPRTGDPDDRHDVARIRLFSCGGDGWRDHGDAFPDGFTPGSREWSGSAVLGADGDTLTHYFTAAGRAGQPRSFEQRLFETRGRLRVIDGVPTVGGWTRPVESIVADRRIYRRADQLEPVGGLIKGFRDPAYFRDPADGAEYLLFTGSAAWVEQAHDGVIGIARKSGSGWSLGLPILTALGVNAELERPHIVVRGGRYCLFWSTQRVRFAPDGPSGPTGLYAMVADRMAGPWRPANGTGLVAGNPEAEPDQAYCWWVTGELDVISFVDRWGVAGAATRDGADPHPVPFGGTAAPRFSLSVRDDAVLISASATSLSTGISAG